MRTVVLQIMEQLVIWTVAVLLPPNYSHVKAIA